MTRLSDHDLTEREYRTTDRLSQRRLDRTGWLRGEDERLLALQALAAIGPSRVLDAGCGTGDFAALIAAPEVLCVDSSEAAVKATEAKGLTAQVADVQDLPYPDRYFDAVACNWVLYHVPDRRKAIAEFARVLTPSGRFVGCYNAPDHLGALWSALALGDDPDDFNSANGGGELAESFDSVEVREVWGQVLWEERDDLQTYLDAYSELYGPLSAPDVTYPFRAARHNVVFVADRPHPQGTEP